MKIEMALAPEGATRYSRARQTVLNILCDCRRDCLAAADRAIEEDAAVYKSAAESLRFLVKLFEQITPP
jgi:hypothetical protein